MEVLARRAQHQLRMVLSEWYSWLSARSSREYEWLQVPWWAKQMPGRLDIPWAINDLPKYIDNESMIKVLHMVVDEAFLSAEGVDGVPDMTKLHETVTELYESSKQ